MLLQDTTNSLRTVQHSGKNIIYKVLCHRPTPPKYHLLAVALHGVSFHTVPACGGPWLGPSKHHVYSFPRSLILSPSNHILPQLHLAALFAQQHNASQARNRSKSDWHDSRNKAERMSFMVTRNCIKRATKYSRAFIRKRPRPR